MDRPSAHQLTGKLPHSPWEGHPPTLNHTGIVMGMRQGARAAPTASRIAALVVAPTRCRGAALATLTDCPSSTDLRHLMGPTTLTGRNLTPVRVSRRHMRRELHTPGVGPSLGLVRSLIQGIALGRGQEPE